MNRMQAAELQGLVDWLIRTKPRIKLENWYTCALGMYARTGQLVREGNPSMALVHELVLAHEFGGFRLVIRTETYTPPEYRDSFSEVAHWFGITREQAVEVFYPEAGSCYWEEMEKGVCPALAMATHVINWLGMHPPVMEKE